MTKTATAPLGLIDPILALALNGLSLPKPTREKVKPGVYRVRGMIAVDATVTVAEDTEAVQANAVNPWLLLSMALNKLPGAAIEEIVEEAEGVLARKERGEALAEEMVDALEAMKDRAALAVERIKGATRKPKKGAVSVEAVLAERDAVSVERVVTVTKVEATK